MEDDIIHIRSGPVPVTFTIAGITVYVYGLDKLNYDSTIDHLNAVYILHPRLQDYTYSETIANQWLNSYYNNNNKSSRATTTPLIAVTFDNRNHGERMVKPHANEDWSGAERDSDDPNAPAVNNVNHANDMCSGIDGSAQDTALIIDYLPSLLPFKVRSPIRNIISGISLGGHICWRAAQLLGPEKVYAIIPIIGSPNLSLLLLERVYDQVIHQTPAIDYSPHWQTTIADNVYNQLTQSTKYTKLLDIIFPPTLYSHLAHQDYALERHFPTQIKIFMLCGRDDTLVPSKYTEKWLNSRLSLDQRRHPNDLKLFIQPQTGHSCTPEMIQQAADWINAILSPPSPRL